MKHITLVGLIIAALLILLVLASVAVKRTVKENKIIEVISEGCEPTGQFGVLTSGDSFVMYDCTDKKKD